MAQMPLEERSRARLLVLSRRNEKVLHVCFGNIVDHLGGGDCLVLNDTKVLPARLFGKKATGGQVEVLLHKSLGENEWEALIKPSRRVKQGGIVSFGSNGTDLRCEVKDAPRENSGLRTVKFIGGVEVPGILEQLGHIPLPPYIDRPDLAIDRELYQTVFAKNPGAVASPTAGLHFDEKLLENVRAKSVEIIFVTLHVGYGTFQPVAAENIAGHAMHPEAYEVSAEAANCLNRAVREGRRIIACGTTVARTLEAVAVMNGQGGVEVRPGCGETDLFIYPPYRFKIVQGLITNFHLPKTTLLMLVSAFAGREKIFQAYEEAIRERYRFYSYGDAMFII